MAKMKKALAIVMALSMSCSILSLPTFAAEETDDANKVVDVEIVIEDPAYTADADGITTVASGSETSTSENAPEGTVDVPMNPGESNTVVPGAPEGSTTITGDQPEGEGDNEYNYAESTVVQQGSITVSNNGSTVTETPDTEKTDMDHVESGATPDGTNDLVEEFYQGSSTGAPDEYMPGSDPEDREPIPEEDRVDGYEYIYGGTGNTSQFRPAIVFTDPLTDEEKLAKFGDSAYLKNNSVVETYVGYLDEETRNSIAKTEDGKYVTDEEGYVLDIHGNRILRKELTVVGPDGTTYYLHRVDVMSSKLNVEGWYEDGEWVEALNSADSKYQIVYATAQQFVLIDQNTGEVVTVYCADQSTPTEDGFGYNVENLEDAEYYTDEQAAQIRSIAQNGYWGAEGDASTFGSLAALEAKLLASGEFTAEELEALTDGVALTATQMAIWSCSNEMDGLKYINTHYVGNIGDTEAEAGYADFLTKVPTDKVDEAKLLFKIYEWLIALEPIEEKNTTQDTIINEKNFIEKMSITVLDKVRNHFNNMDNDPDNDAYTTNLTFSLVVAPGENNYDDDPTNDDDLVVQIVDQNGNVVVSGRIAGEVQSGEQLLVPDDDGNYTISGVVMTEGDMTFNITLTGIQNLDHGVYLYTSEIRNDNGEEVSSQTMVGVSSGSYGVNVSMDLNFSLNVQDEIIVTERVWSTEYQNPPVEDPEEESDPEDPDEEIDPVEETTEIPDEETPAAEIQDEIVNIPDEETPLVEIPDEDIPLANIPKTGDASLVWAVVSLLSGAGLCGLSFAGKKKDEE